MPAHFLGLADASTLDTAEFQMTSRMIDDLIAHEAVGVFHGPAGAGKTFAVDAKLEQLRATSSHQMVITCSLAFPSDPTMRRVAAELTTALTGVEPSTSAGRFVLINNLIRLLSGPKRLVVIDEAQRLNGNCIEMIRHLHDDKRTNFALLYVGGDGCWEVLSREPMLRSRVFRRLPFRPVPGEHIPALIRGYHPIYAQASDELLLDINDAYAHGILRDWAAFTHTAAGLCRDAGLDRLDAKTINNAFALLGGGV